MPYFFNKATSPTVLVTRPSVDGLYLTLSLKQHGYNPLHALLVTFSEGLDCRKIPYMINNFDSKDALILSSKAAIPFVSKYIRKWPKIRYYAMGVGSAFDLNKITNSKVIYPEQGIGSKALWEILKCDLPNKTIIIKGNEGSNWLFEKLIYNKKKVFNSICYHRNWIPFSITDICYWQKKDVDLIVFTSLDLLKFFYHNTPKNFFPWLITRKLVVISEKMRKQAEEWGWQEVVLVSSPRNKDILEKINILYGNKYVPRLHM